MKRLYPILIATVLLSSCRKEETALSGRVKHYPHDCISLYKVTDGGFELIEVQQLKADSLFHFIRPKSRADFYYIGVDDQAKTIFSELYMAEGKSEKLLIEDMKIDRSSLSNQVFADYRQAWKDIMAKYGSRVYRYRHDINEMTSIINNFHRAYIAYKANVNSPDAVFNQLMTLRAQVDFETIMLRVYSMVSADIGNKMLEQAAFQAILSNPLRSADVLKVNQGSLLMANYTSFKARQAKEHPDDYLKFCMDIFHNDTLKGQYLKDHIIRRKVSGKDYEKLMGRYGKYLLTEKQKADMAAYETEIMKFAEGQPAHDFSYEDVNGQTHALSDYKGKVVLVDVWATWCAPCKAEIPHLEKLIDHYCDEPDVQFISVSIDKPKDRKKWEDFIKEKHMKGLQLIADKAFKSKILTDYEITGVPRFMLFNKEGKIVSVNASRPSNPRLKELIDEQL